MSDLRYYGCYATIETESKDKGAALQNADNIVGDVYSITFKTVDGSPEVHLINKFNKDVAFFDTKTSRELSVMQARGWTIRATLAMVAFTDTPDPGRFWGQAVLICNAPEYNDACDTFANGICAALREGKRPEISLGSQAIDTMLKAQGAWMPSKTNKISKRKGTVVLKSKMSSSEKMIEQGRQKNKGCYIGSWIFIIIVVGAIIFGALKLFGVL